MNRIYILVLVFSFLLANDVQTMEDRNSRNSFLSRARSAFHQAASADQRIEKILQENGNNVNAVIEIGNEPYTLLAYAVQSGSLPMVKRLLGEGSEIRMSPTRQTGILSLALARGDTGIIDELLSRNLPTSEIEDVNSYALVLQAGIDLIRNYRPRSPARHRPTAQRVDSALLDRLALNPGSGLEAQAINAGDAGDTWSLLTLLDKMDVTAIQRIFDYHRFEWPIETLELLTSRGARANLHFASWANLEDERLLFFLCNGGRDSINTESAFGTPLFSAIVNDAKLDHILILLEKGAVPNIKYSDSKMTPKEWALRRIDTLYKKIASGNDSKSASEEIDKLKKIVELLSSEEVHVDLYSSWRHSAPLRGDTSPINQRFMGGTL